MKLYVQTNQASPALTLLAIGDWAQGGFVDEANHAELGLAEVTFPDASQDQDARVRAVATKVDGVWVGSWEIVTDEMLLAEAIAAQARRSRDARLNDSDWTQMPDSNVDKEAWVAYRQALRDVPNQAGFPTNIQWPVKP